MFQVTVETNRHAALAKVWVTCPSCKHKDWFYNLCIKRCSNCGFVIGNIYGIDYNLEKRLTFHKEGFKGNE